MGKEANYWLVVNEDPVFTCKAMEEFLKTNTPPQKILVAPRFSSCNTKSYQFSTTAKSVAILGLRFCLPYMFASSMKKQLDSFSQSLDYEFIEDVNQLKAWSFENRPDFVISICSQVYKKQTIDHIGCPIINIHGGHIPGNRSRYPFFWACYHQENQYATSHLITEKIDQGPILFIQDLGRPKSAADATRNFALELPVLLEKTLEQLVEGSFFDLQPKRGIYRGAPRWLDILRYRLRLLK